VIRKLLTAANAKILKGAAQGFRTFGLHLAPWNLSGFQVCASASLGCIAGCLNKAGHGGMFKKGETTNTVQEARKRKTAWFFNERDMFMARLVREVQNGVKYAAKRNVTPVFRLNLTSDVRWETVPVTVAGIEYPNIMEAFSTVQFYDYTKHRNRRDLPANYHLTFSRSEANNDAALEWLAAGGNVAVVFDTKKGQNLPETWNGYRVIDGDLTDLRFLDDKNVVVGLRAKGPARKDTSGFVVHTATMEA
jgi:hypothetical protein